MVVSVNTEDVDDGKRTVPNVRFLMVLDNRHKTASVKWVFTMGRLNRYRSGASRGGRR